jgi:amino acid transporter
MKKLAGCLAVIAAYLLLWFITTIISYEFSWTIYIILMVLSFAFFYYWYEYAESGPEWLKKAIKNQEN